MYFNEDSRYNGQRSVAVCDLRKASRADQFFPIIILIVMIGDTATLVKLSRTKQSLEFTRFSLAHV